MEAELLKVIKCQQNTVRAVRYNVDGNYCLTCGADKKLKLWNPYKSLYLNTYGGHADEVTDACASSDSSRIISCGVDKSVILWDVATSHVIKRFRGHAGRINCVKYNEDSTVAVSGSHDNRVLCWDVKGCLTEPIQILKEAKDCITSLQVTDHEILVGSLDSYVRQYDIRMGKLIKDCIGEPVLSTSFTRDSQCILVSSSNIVRLIDKETGELLAEYKGHKTENYVIESSMDSKDQYIFSGSSSENLYCWELISGDLYKLFPHPNEKHITSISTHPRGNYFLTAAGDSIFLWGPPTSEEASFDDV